MSSQYFTIAEIQAWMLLHAAGYPGYACMTTLDDPDYHKAGNDIIKLAEEVKASRAIAAMYKQ